MLSLDAPGRQSTASARKVAISSACATRLASSASSAMKPASTTALSWSSRARAAQVCVSQGSRTALAGSQVP